MTKQAQDEGKTENGQPQEPTLKGDRAMRDIDTLVEAIGYTQGQVASTCAQGHDMTPPPRLLAAIDAVRARLVAADDAIEMAWGIIANASGGNWERESEEWRAAAARWLDTHFGPMTARRAESSDPADHHGEAPNA